jgi:hypothetical protein
VAKLKISAFQAKILRPQLVSQDLPEAVTVNVVRAWEPNPPKGTSAVEWILLTTEAIATPEDILAVLEGYKTRWVIEEFFKVLKSGCAYEKRELQTLHALRNALPFFVVIAAQLLSWKQLARQHLRLPDFEPVSQARIRVLRHKGLLKRDSKLWASEFLIAVAKLGGHQKSNGEPGWKVIWRGYRSLLLLEEGFLLRGPLEDL